MAIYTTLLLIAISLAIILPLAIYAWRLKRQLQQQKQQQQALATEQQQKKEETLVSIQVIATGALQQEVNHTEASIRISALLDSLTADETVKQPFTTIYTLAAATFTIPRNEKWQQLTRQQRDRYRTEMEQLENQHQEKLLEELQVINDKIASNTLV